MEKRSRFIGQVWPVDSEPQARELIAQTKAAYHDARHHCWCYLLRGTEAGGAAVVRYADDGEPQGTAGQPILEVFRRGGVENVLCVVTRYFGGILLGAGGLTRAYAGTAKLALDDAGLAEMRLWTAAEFACPYGFFERLKKELETDGGVVDAVDYGVEVTVHAAFPEDRTAAFLEKLREMSAGTIGAAVTGQKHIAAPVNSSCGPAGGK
jgi:uncharacterized YigZ family protein